MSQPRTRSLVAFAAAALVALATAVPAAAAPPDAEHVKPVKTEHPHRAVCAASGPETARCLAHERTDVGGAQPARAHDGASPDVIGNGGAYDPGYLLAAYNLTALAASGGVGKTVAIVDAYDDPTAAADLNYYRSYFGLPACTAASGCFKKVSQTGSTKALPAFDAGWAKEIALDLDMVSSICPNCKILLVEARSNGYADLAAAVDYAARQPGVVAISNSYGGMEFAGEATYESHYNHPGVAITVSSGDAGYGVEFPAASRYVTAVGGTSLLPDGTTARGWTESVWSGAGAGCSAYVPKPSWQTDGGCANRTVADVSAVADPSTGVWTYYKGGWYVDGGTSVAAPIVASVYALAGNTASLNAGSSSYGQAGALNDVVAGNDGTCSPGAPYLCTGVPGYDGPTGNGTPNGVGAF